MEEKIEEYTLAQLVDYYETDKEMDVIGKTIKVKGRVRSIKEGTRSESGYDKAYSSTVKSFLIGDDEGRNLIVNAELRNTNNSYTGWVLHTMEGDELDLQIKYEGHLTGSITRIDNKNLKETLKGTNQ